MAIQVIERDTPFGQVAQNFGKSLGESFSEEFGRQRQAAGLAQIAKRAEEDDTFTLGQAYQQMLRSGVDASQLPQFQQVLGDVVRSGALRRRGEMGRPTDQPTTVEGVVMDESVQAPPDIAPKQPPSQVREFPTTLLTEEDQRVLQQQPIPVTTSNIQSEMARMQREEPKTWLTIDELESRARQNLGARNDELAARQGVAQQRDQLSTRARDEFTKRLNNKLQARGLEDTWSQMPQQMQDRIFSQVIEDVQRGKTAPQAAEQAATSALNDVRNIGQFFDEPGPSIFTGAADDVKKNLGQYRRPFEETGTLDEFTGLLMQKGSGEHEAASIARPASDSLAKELAKLQPQATKTANMHKKLTKGLGLSLLGPLAPAAIPFAAVAEEFQGPTAKPEESRKAAEQIMAAMTDEDSINAAALALNDAGYDDRMLYEVARDLQAEGQYNPAPHQERELNRAAPVEPSLLDIWSIVTSPARGTKGKYGFWEAITRRYFGKR